MKLIISALALSVLAVTPAFAKDVSVGGYTRRDGTYVAPYVRSAPNSTKADNYGPAPRSSNTFGASPLYSAPPRSRDADGDLTPNYRDRDDNNNAIHDDRDASQYRQSPSSIFGR